jgi:hypothetical protein
VGRSLIAFVCCLASFAQDNGFVSLFNGRDLVPWAGDETQWKVEQALLTGASDGKSVSTLVIDSGAYGNFELRFDLRVKRGAASVKMRGPGKGPLASSWKSANPSSDGSSTALPSPSSRTSSPASGTPIASSPRVTPSMSSTTDSALPTPSWRAISLPAASWHSPFPPARPPKSTYAIYESESRLVSNI